MLHRSVPYQLNTSEATNPQSVDDVKVGQVESEVKCILCLIPVVPEKSRGWKENMGKGLETR